MKSKAQTMVEINEHAIRVLYKELGAVNAIRFLNQYSNGSGDHTRDRRQILGEQTLDSIFAEIEAKKRDAI